MKKKITTETLAQELALFQKNTLEKYDGMDKSIDNLTLMVLNYEGRITDLETDNRTLTDMVGKLDFKVEELIKYQKKL